MQVVPGKIYVFRLGDKTFKVLWFWREDSDDEQFYLQLLERNAPSDEVNDLLASMEQFPNTDSYETTEAMLHNAMAHAKAEGWTIADEAYDHANDPIWV